MIPSYVHPIAVAALPYVLPVEEDVTGIVLPVSVQERQQAALSRAARRLDKICLTAFQSHFLKPHFAPYVGAGSEDFGKYVLQLYLIHASYLSTLTL